MGLDGSQKMKDPVTRSGPHKTREFERVIQVLKISW